MTINAKYSSKCPNCDGRIQIGELVEWTKGNPATHVVCGAPATSYQVGDRITVRRERELRLSSGQIRTHKTVCFDYDDASYEAYLASDKGLRAAPFDQATQRDVDDESYDAWMAFQTASHPLRRQLARDDDSNPEVSTSQQNAWNDSYEADDVCRMCAPFPCDDPDRHLGVPSRYTPLANRGCHCGADFDGRDCMCFEGYGE